MLLDTLSALLRSKQQNAESKPDSPQPCSCACTSVVPVLQPEATVPAAVTPAAQPVRVPFVRPLIPPCIPPKPLRSCSKLRVIYRAHDKSIYINDTRAILATDARSELADLEAERQQLVKLRRPPNVSLKARDLLRFGVEVICFLSIGRRSVLIPLDGVVEVGTIETRLQQVIRSESTTARDGA